AHPSPHFSRSDRNGPRSLHVWSWQDTPTPLHSQNRASAFFWSWLQHRCAPSPHDLRVFDSHALECGGLPPLFRRMLPRETIFLRSVLRPRAFSFSTLILDLLPPRAANSLYAPHLHSI